MNISTKLALGVAAVLGLALLARDNLSMLFTLAVIVATLTFKTTWQFMFTIVQMAGILLGGIGHGIGWCGDVIAEWSEGCKRFLSNHDQESQELQDPESSDGSEEPEDDLDVPDFLKDDESKQSGDVGLDILEPRDR